MNPNWRELRLVVNELLSRHLGAENLMPELQEEDSAEERRTPFWHWLFRVSPVLLAPRQGDGVRAIGEALMCFDPSEEAWQGCFWKLVDAVALWSDIRALRMLTAMTPEEAK